MSAPSPLLLRIVVPLERLVEAVGRAAAWCSVAMVLLMFAIVLLRYLFNTGWIAMQELVIYLHAALFMLGAAYTLKHDGHVRVDIFYRRLGPVGRARVDLFGALFLLLPVCGFVVWISWDYVADAWRLLEGSQEVGGLPGVFLLKTLLLLLGGLLFLQGVAQALRALLVLRGHVEADGAHDAPREL